MKSKDHRLFIAVELPDCVQEVILKIQQELKKHQVFEGRFTKFGHMHITLKFLGSVEQKNIPAIIQALRSISFNTFSTCLDGFDFFSKKNAASVLWLGVQGKYFKLLAQDVDNALSLIFPPEKDVLIPHITLVRLKKIYDQQEFMNTIESIQVPTTCFPVKYFVLKKSMLSVKGSEYFDIARFALQD